MDATDLRLSYFRPELHHIIQCSNVVVPHRVKKKQLCKQGSPEHVQGHEWSSTLVS